MLDRRLAEIVPQAERQIQALGLALSLEAVTDANVVASDGWVYGYKAHVTISVPSTTVRAVLSAAVTGNTCESHILQSHLDDLPPRVNTLLLNASYDNGELLTARAQRGLQVLVPLSKPVGKSTSQMRRDPAAYLASPEGKARYQQRGCSIEPFFATLKNFFHLDPLPVQGKTLASVVIPLSLYAWDLLVLLHFVNHRPLGQVKPILDLLWLGTPLSLN